MRAIQKILGVTRNCSRWSESEARKLQETILRTVSLENMLSANVFEMLFILMGCSIQEESNEMRVSLKTH